MDADRDYLPTLDGWRAVAVVLVLACHCALGTQLAPRWKALGALAGDEGVSVFFAISGLLITWRLLRERGRNGDIRLGQFYLRRGFRILPAAFVYLAAVAVFVPTPRVSLAAAAFFLRNYVAAPGWAVAHYWSLSVEEHFYLLWPFLLAKLGTRRAAWTGAGLAVAVYFWRAWDGAHGWLATGSVVFWWRTDIRLDALLYGCLAAVALNSRLRAAIARRLKLLAWLFVAGTFIAAALGRVPPGSFNASLQAICLPILLVGTLLHPAWLFSRVLESFPLRWLGRISYSLYLWQQIFLVHRNPGQLPWRLAAAMAAACASYYLIERPLIRLGKRWSQRAAAQTMAASG